MPRASSRKSAFTLRIPEQFIETFDKLVELGFTPGKNRNQAIINLMRSAMEDVYFVLQAYERAQELAKTEQFQNSNLPADFRKMQLALELLSQTPVDAVVEKYQTIIGAMLANSKNPELSELKAKLNSLLEQDEVDENE